VTVAGFVEVCAVDIASMVVEEMLRQLQAELMRLLGMADKVRQAGAGADVAARLRTGVKVVDEYIKDVDVIVDVRVETLVVEESIVWVETDGTVTGTVVVMVTDEVSTDVSTAVAPEVDTMVDVIVTGLVMTVVEIDVAPDVKTAIDVEVTGTVITVVYTEVNVVRVLEMAIDVVSVVDISVETSVYTEV
jgi:hypothetical protein